ncbi:MAG: methyltransferase domain-containing protein [Myxococcota bacterium]|nr:methyltransferase domain-containing protein [Myxococcota bacterium]
MPEEKSKKQILSRLFSQSAQRLVLFDWLSERARFDGDPKAAELIEQLHAHERIQAFGHLDFLLKSLPLLNTEVVESQRNLSAIQSHLQDSLLADLNTAKSDLQGIGQHDTADWINALLRQNEESLRILHEFQVPQHHAELAQNPPTREQVISHFSDRAERYDRSSHWCTDTELRKAVLDLLQPQAEHTVLDIACGTGLVSQWFHRKVKHVLGVDITPAMFAQARTRLDEFRVGPGEDLPVESNRFDIVICRQGTQFMNDATAISEMTRAARPGGLVCVINLCAYGEEDKEEYFEILRLRNPVRRNFYLRSDLQSLFEAAGLEDVQVHDHISIEDVDVWSNNGAISEARREAIRKCYRHASPSFSDLHQVQRKETGLIVDKMLFGIAIGKKPQSERA